MSEFVDSLEIETWTLWSVGIVLVACRMISRRMKFRSWSSLQFEDWLMMVVAALFTADMVCINTTSKNGTNYMADEDVAKLTPLQAERAIYGSKVVLALELCSLGTIWLVKICLLILYHRLTSVLVAYERQHLIVKIIGVFCIISFALVVFLLLFHWCSPIEGYWALPVTNSECATYYKHMIFATSFNISTDLMLLCIPIPIVIQSRIPMKRCAPTKIVLCCVLGLGCLNILVAVLNRYFNFTNPNSMFYLYWYVAELATAVYVGNLPLCWQLIAHVFSMGTWASFGSSADRPKAPLPGPADQEFIPKKKPKRFIQSMLPASLWSTQNDGLGGTTRVEGRRSGTVKTRSASEEAIVWSEAITEEEDRTDRDVELSAMDRKADASITSVDEVASPRRAGD
ncbi:hypothetical protein B0T18DRAFT_321746 [Schizothecium vesticola]|uniref:Rhodopsin domain-containing protein n=1 Tax=Schizothecium vesticola TaxID=314040 RepID=A0AA40F0Z7_9PEZI|nr:hypothetical protein B0T18DRAFT_321746 [Schizothecium vesticola]